MIYIKKGKEPESLSLYKKQKFASYDGANKEDIREALLRDQGHICAYCMRRIENDREKMKIEHWKPQSHLKSEQEKLDYRIMLGVCDGCKGNDYRYTTCDEHRGNVELIVTPYDARMMATIFYTRDGLIHSSDSDIDRDLDQVLNLNCLKATSMLVLNRKNVYQEVKSRLMRLQKNGNWTNKTLMTVAGFYEKKSDVYPAYVGVAQYVLNRYLNK